MRITITYNLRQDDSESTAELISSEDIDRIYKTIAGIPTLVCQEGGYNTQVVGMCVKNFLTGLMNGPE